MHKSWTKLVFALLALSTAGTIAVTGCNQQKPLSDLTRTVQQAQEGDPVTAAEDYERVFQETTKMLDDKSSLRIATAKGGYIFSILQQPGTAEKIVCHDTDPTLSFAKCCRDYAQAYGCITITYSPSSGWNGNTCN